MSKHDGNSSMNSKEGVKPSWSKRIPVKRLQRMLNVSCAERDANVSEPSTTKMLQRSAASNSLRESIRSRINSLIAIFLI